jgi:hypothetical protein
VRVYWSDPRLLKVTRTWDPTANSRCIARDPTEMLSSAMMLSASLSSLEVVKLNSDDYSDRDIDIFPANQIPAFWTKLNTPSDVSSDKNSDVNWYFFYVQLWKNTLRQERQCGTMPSTQFQRTELRMVCMQHWLSPSTCAYQWKTSDFGTYLVSHEGLVAARPKNVTWRRLICSHVK